MTEEANVTEQAQQAAPSAPPAQPADPAVRIPTVDDPPPLAPPPAPAPAAPPPPAAAGTDAVPVPRGDEDFAPSRPPAGPETVEEAQDIELQGHLRHLFTGAQLAPDVLIVCIPVNQAVYGQVVNGVPTPRVRLQRRPDGLHDMVLGG